MSLKARLTRMEHIEGRLNLARQHRFCMLVASDAEEEAARQEIAERGYDPDRDLFLIRLVPLCPAEATKCET